MEARLPELLRETLGEETVGSRSHPEPYDDDADSITNNMARLSAACLAATPGSGSGSGSGGKPLEPVQEAWRAGLVLQLMLAFCRMQAAPALQAAPDLLGPQPVWVAKLVGLTTATPNLLLGDPLEALLGRLQLACREAPWATAAPADDNIVGLTVGRGGWWLSSVAELLEGLVGCSSGRAALMACTTAGESEEAGVSRAEGSSDAGRGDAARAERRAPAPTKAGTPRSSLLACCLAMLDGEAQRLRQARGLPTPRFCLPCSAWACLEVAAKLFGSTVTTAGIREAGELAAAVSSLLQTLFIRRGGDGTVSAPGGLVGGRGAPDPDPYIDPGLDPAWAAAADVLLSLCGSPSAALQVCSCCPEAIAACAERACQRLRGLYPGPEGPRALYPWEGPEGPRALYPREGPVGARNFLSRQDVLQPSGGGEDAASLMRSISVFAMPASGLQALLSHGARRNPLVLRPDSLIVLYYCCHPLLYRP